MKKIKQILAIIGIIILVGLYVLTLVIAITGQGDWFKFFAASIAATVLIPITIWLLIQMIKKFKGED
ncbi:MAG: hypothetical protein MJ110_03195 [Lachnospiraceae bacterium]|nr:hypothetical protein [Lachnospiraceae bacterium]